MSNLGLGNPIFSRDNMPLLYPGPIRSLPEDSGEKAGNAGLPRFRSISRMPVHLLYRHILFRRAGSWWRVGHKVHLLVGRRRGRCYILQGKISSLAAGISNAFGESVLRNRRTSAQCRWSMLTSVPTLASAQVGFAHCLRHSSLSVQGGNFKFFERDILNTFEA